MDHSPLKYRKVHLGSKKDLAQFYEGTDHLTSRSPKSPSSPKSRKSISHVSPKSSRDNDTKEKWIREKEMRRSQSFSVIKKKDRMPKSNASNSKLEKSMSKLSFQTKTKVDNSSIKLNSPSEKNLNKSPFSFKVLPSDKVDGDGLRK